MKKIIKFFGKPLTVMDWIRLVIEIVTLTITSVCVSDGNNAWYIICLLAGSCIALLIFVIQFICLAVNNRNKQNV